MSLEHSFATEAPTQKPVTKGDEKVELLFDVGGTIFAIERHLIDRWPTSLLSELLKKSDADELRGTRLDGFSLIWAPVYDCSGSLTTSVAAGLRLGLPSA